MTGFRLVGLVIALSAMILALGAFDASLTESLILYFVVAIFWNTREDL